MLSVQIKLPRRTILKRCSDSADECYFAGVRFLDDEFSPWRKAILMFSNLETARRFIRDNRLEGWLPAFIDYSCLRRLFVWERDQGVNWAVLDFSNKRRSQMVRAFRLQAAIRAINSADIEHDDPIVIEGNCFEMQRC